MGLDPAATRRWGHGRGGGGASQGHLEESLTLTTMSNARGGMAEVRPRTRPPAGRPGARFLEDHPDAAPILSILAAPDTDNTTPRDVLPSPRYPAATPVHDRVHARRRRGRRRRRRRGLLRLHAVAPGERLWRNAISILSSSLNRIAFCFISHLNASAQVVPDATASSRNGTATAPRSSR